MKRSQVDKIETGEMIRRKKSAVEVRVTKVGVTISPWERVPMLSAFGKRCKRCIKALTRKTQYREHRTRLTTPLKLIFEASLELKELPHDWVNANLLSIKKAKSPNYATTDQLVLRVFCAK